MLHEICYVYCCTVCNSECVLMILLQATLLLLRIFLVVFHLPWSRRHQFRKHDVQHSAMPLLESLLFQEHVSSILVRCHWHIFLGKLSEFVTKNIYRFWSNNPKNNYWQWIMGMGLLKTPLWLEKVGPHCYKVNCHSGDGLSYWCSSENLVISVLVYS